MFTHLRFSFARFAFFAFVLASFWYAPSSAQISKHAQADLLTVEIASALKRRDASAALVAISRYKALQLDIPLAIKFKEAQLAALVKDFLRAGESLDAYLKTAPQSDDDYGSALALHEQIKTDVALTKDAFSKAWEMTYRERTRDNAQAIVEALSIAHSISPGSPKIIQMRGVQYSALGEKNRAIEDYTNVISLDPLNVDSLKLRGYIYFYALNFPKALADVDQALAISKNDIPALSASCVMRAAANIQLDRAIADCGTAIRIDDYPGVARFGRGLWNLRKGNHKSAIDDFNYCLSTDNCYVGDAWFALSVAHARNGDQASSQISKANADRYHQSFSNVFKLTEFN